MSSYRLRLRGAAGVVVATLLFATTGAVGGPGELTVVSVGPMEEPLHQVLALFERDVGLTVAVSYAQRGQLAAKVRGADHPDVVIATQDEMDMLGRDDQIQSASRAALCRVGFGVAKHKSAPALDLSSTDALKRALLQAKSLSYADPQDGPAGRQAIAVVERLGIADALKTKTRLGTGSNRVASIGFGDVEMGLYPIDEILRAPGVTLAAPLPAELQQWTRYDVALIGGAPNRSEARRLLAFLIGASARASLKAKGFESFE